MWSHVFRHVSHVLCVFRHVSHVLCVFRHVSHVFSCIQACLPCVFMRVLCPIIISWPLKVQGVIYIPVIPFVMSHYCHWVVLFSRPETLSAGELTTLVFSEYTMTVLKLYYVVYIILYYEW
jgi:hypothetical protein